MVAGGIDGFGRNVHGRKIEGIIEKTRRIEADGYGNADSVGGTGRGGGEGGWVGGGFERGRRGFLGNPTTRFMLALGGGQLQKTQVLELSDKFDFSRADLLAEVGVYLAEAAKRLKNPRPDCYLTLHGLPLSFEKFTWPFHASTSGADTFLVHGEVRLEDGESSSAACEGCGVDDGDVCGDCEGAGAAVCGRIHLQRGAEDDGPGTTGAGEERQSAAGSSDDAVL